MQTEKDLGLAVYPVTDFLILDSTPTWNQTFEYEQMGAILFHTTALLTIINSLAPSAF